MAETNQGGNDRTGGRPRKPRKAGSSACDDSCSCRLSSVEGRNLESRRSPPDRPAECHQDEVGEDKSLPVDKAPDPQPDHGRGSDQRPVDGIRQIERQSQSERPEELNDQHRGVSRRQSQRVPNRHVLLNDTFRYRAFRSACCSWVIREKTGIHGSHSR
jgi:hypothetical protein